MKAPSIFLSTVWVLFVATSLIAVSRACTLNLARYGKLLPLSGLPNDQELYSLGISKAEAVSISLYTSLDGHFIHWNEILRSKNYKAVTKETCSNLLQWYFPGDDSYHAKPVNINYARIKPFVECAENGLMQLQPPFGDYDYPLLERFILNKVSSKVRAQWKVGSLVVEPAFTSATRCRKSVGHPAPRYIWLIQPLRGGARRSEGRSVECISQMPGEREVLFPRGTRWCFLSVEYEDPYPDGTLPARTISTTDQTTTVIETKRRGSLSASSSSSSSSSDTDGEDLGAQKEQKCRKLFFGKNEYNFDDTTHAADDDNVSTTSSNSNVTKKTKKKKPPKRFFGSSPTVYYTVAEVDDTTDCRALARNFAAGKCPDNYSYLCDPVQYKCDAEMYECAGGALQSKGSASTVKKTNHNAREEKKPALRSPEADRKRLQNILSGIEDSTF